MIRNANLQLVRRWQLSYEDRMGINKAVQIAANENAQLDDLLDEIKKHASYLGDCSIRVWGEGYAEIGTIMISHGVVTARPA